MMVESIHNAALRRMVENLKVASMVEDGQSVDMSTICPSDLKELRGHVQAGRDTIAQEDSLSDDMKTFLQIHDDLLEVIDQRSKEVAQYV